ncbi:putative nonaspanin (TM9SF) [Rosa chinensis]|uniref:Transmembrane 9 superfamily member n=1 Tax=Rosa chinensis TaxID=74649 RepID=A0A2P6SAG3_ROSCH|nr:putative nonaspanin (TM9SF) [Rosa chinensis]
MGRQISGCSSLLIIIVLPLISSAAHNFSLPGVAPRDFHTATGDPLSIEVNKLSSTKTQHTYDYYYLSYCNTEIIKSAENLGEVLRGDQIENSVYAFKKRTASSSSSSSNPGFFNPSSSSSKIMVIAELNFNCERDGGIKVTGRSSREKMRERESI